MTPDDRPVPRTCTACQQVFTIDAAEQRFLADRAREAGSAWTLPRRCLPCRRARRQAAYEQPADPFVEVWLTCADCSQPFVFGGRDAQYFAAHGWPQPKRCRPCRVARRG